MPSCPKDSVISTEAARLCAAQRRDRCILLVTQHNFTQNNTVILSEGERALCVPRSRRSPMRPVHPMRFAPFSPDRAGRSAGLSGK
jgi:hypothetical protein